MAAATEPLLMTVDEYRELPQREDVIQELHWGQVVTLTRPKMTHARVQLQLIDLLKPLASQLGVVAAEVAFRALPEYDLRGADVAFVSRDRWDGAKGNDNLRGTPELVIEVLSPSNTKAEMRQKAVLYLSTGAQEFWIVDPSKLTVTVLHRDGRNLLYSAKDTIPLTLFNAELPVSDIFSQL